MDQAQYNYGEFVASPDEFLELGIAAEVNAALVFVIDGRRNRVDKRLQEPMLLAQRVINLFLSVVSHYPYAPLKLPSLRDVEHAHISEPPASRKLYRIAGRGKM